MEARYEIARFDEIPGTPCPCGEAKRAFAESGNVASIHVVEIKKDSRVHFHKKMTEIYFILEGEGYLELDGEKIPVQPRTTAMIRPGCRHRAVGDLKILNIPVPAFDPEDEWFDDD
ncbi:MAG: cupin domain-containing protein [Verrucomicrobiota bacterium]